MNMIIIDTFIHFMRIFVDVTLLKLKYVNKIKLLPRDIIEIIKSYCFIHINEVLKIRFYQEQKAITNQLIKSSFSRNSDTQELIEEYGEWIMAHPIINNDINNTSIAWIFGFSNNIEINKERWNYNKIPFNYSLLERQQDFEIQGDNCKKCGEFTFTSYDILQRLPSKIKLCDCNNDMYIVDAAS